MSRSVQTIALFVCLLLASRCDVRAQVVISEFLASNQSKLADENGDYSDWIELHNTNSSPVNLDGWFLTDNAANLTKWRLPATNIAAQGYLVVFASNKDRPSPARVCIPALP